MGAVPNTVAAAEGAANNGAERAAQAARAKPTKRRGPRPKHIPQRMCVACRDHAAKRTLIRLVRTPDGTVEVDPTGKKNGRGAYLCELPVCWEKALKTGLLSRALNITLTQETIASLRQYAATLPASKPTGGATAEEGT